jgi:hypothetical protein
MKIEKPLWLADQPSVEVVVTGLVIAFALLVAALYLFLSR